MEHLILLITAVLSGVTSIPLTALAVRHHQHMRALHRSHRELRLHLGPNGDEEPTPREVVAQGDRAA